MCAIGKGKGLGRGYGVQQDGRYTEAGGWRSILICYLGWESILSAVKSHKARLKLLCTHWREPVVYYIFPFQTGELGERHQISIPQGSPASKFIWRPKGKWSPGWPMDFKSRLPILWLGFQNRPSFLLALLTSAQSISEVCSLQA